MQALAEQESSGDELSGSDIVNLAGQGSEVKDTADVCVDDEATDLAQLARSKLCVDADESEGDAIEESLEIAANIGEPGKKMNAKQKQLKRRAAKAAEQYKSSLAVEHSADSASTREPDSDDDVRSRKKKGGKAGKKQSTQQPTMDSVDPQIDLSCTCGVCKAKFGSRSLLFAHIKSTGHALLKSAP